MPAANAGVSSPCSCTALSPASAATAVDVVGRLIHEHADGRRRTAAARRRSRARATGRRTAGSPARTRTRARPRRASTAASRILQPRDAADLDEHRRTDPSTRTRSIRSDLVPCVLRDRASSRSAASAAPGSSVGHEPLADQKRAVAERRAAARDRRRVFRPLSLTAIDVRPASARSAPRTRGHPPRACAGSGC